MGLARRFMEYRKAEDEARAAEEAVGIEAGDILRGYLPAINSIVGAGADQVGALSNSATAGGYAENLNDIMAGEQFKTLVGERQNAATNYAASRGLRRSGSAMQEAANIPTDLAFQIESELNNRRNAVANRAAGGISQGLGIGRGLIDNQAILSGIRLNQQQFDNQRTAQANATSGAFLQGAIDIGGVLF